MDKEEEERKEEVAPIKQKRKYQEIWDRVISRAQRGDSRPIVIQVKGCSDRWFQRIRKAYYNEKDLDKTNNVLWRAKVERLEDDKIAFSVVRKDWKERF